MKDLQSLFAEAEAEMKCRSGGVRQFFTHFYHKKIVSKYALREVVRHGLQWKLPYDGMGKHVIRTGHVDVPLLRYFLPQAQSRGCDILLDIGANVGCFCLIAAKAELFKKIHAIEPIPSTSENLRWNVDANNFSDLISVHSVAASNQCGLLQMVCDSDSSGISRVVDDKGDMEIEGVTLDSLFDFRERKLAVKIDVEGHELATLQGAENLFAANDIFLQVEVWNENTHTIEYLLSQGFKMLHYHAHAHYYADFYFERQRQC